MDFVASLRLSAYLQLDGTHVPGEDGAFALRETRDHHGAVSGLGQYPRLSGGL